MKYDHKKVQESKKTIAKTNLKKAIKEFVIYKVNVNGEFAGVYILDKDYASQFNWGFRPFFIGTKEECEAEVKRCGWKVLDFKPSGYVDNDLWHDFSQE